MLIVLAIAGLWVLGMLIALGVCASAAAGDRDLAARAAAGEGEAFYLGIPAHRPAA